MMEVRTLKNGITVLLSPDKNSETVCVLVGVGVGSNNEEKSEHGIAHFFEHMCFKGTKTYPDHVKLLTRIDQLGVVSNAYTSREYTAYYLYGRAEQIANMIELTADMFLHSIFSETELEKEKGVILQEIAMYEDNPHAKADEVVEKSLFAGTVVEHNVLGTADSVTKFSKDDFISFLEKHYTANNTVLSITGNFCVDKVLSELEEKYHNVKEGAHTKQVVINPQGRSQKHASIVRKELEQMSIVIGSYAPAYTDPDFYAAEVFDMVLGGSMSSRLFLRVREHLGACYTIGTRIESHTYAGMFSIYTGINSGKLTEVIDAIGEECALIRKVAISEEELHKAQELLLGIAALRKENKQHLASNQMAAYVQKTEVPGSEIYIKNIRNVTPKDVQRVANKILDKSNTSICYVGNIEVDEAVSESLCNSLEQ